MAQYLPVLLVSVSAVSSNPAPDDSALDTQAIGQVDYLSHEWQEEDVAKSWRNMTRRKDSIQNGARLENASWRTWWKQRNNLPTVSPETLNWLKDSDVTWLYGPLHTAADWAPPPRHSPEPECVTSSPTSPTLGPSTIHPDAGLRTHVSAHAARSNSPWSLKPILKHRSISELLSISLPPSPGSDPMELEEPPVTKHEVARKRPKLTHTKSDSNVHQRNPFRRDSPPLPLATSHEPATAQRGRHISFNTFVEQCIAIEKPKDSFDEEDEDGYCEDDEESEEEESEEDVLEMRPTQHTRRRTSSLSATSTSAWAALDISSPEREHVTIAPIAPTMLKTSATPSPVASWNLWTDDLEEEALFAGAGTGARHTHPASVNLVYVPPHGSTYARKEETSFEPVEFFAESTPAPAAAPEPTPPTSLPVPVPVPASRALGSSLLEPPTRGRPTSRERERGRSRSRSRSSAEESVSPRSGTPFGVGAGTVRERSRSLSLSPEEREREGHGRGRRGKRRAREESVSLSPSEDVAATATSTPANSPNTAFQPLGRAPAEDAATLIGFVSSAKDYLGSFWGSSERIPDAPGASAR